MIFDPGNKVLLALPRWLANRLENDATSLGMHPALLIYAMLEKMTEPKWQYIFNHRQRYFDGYSGQDNDIGINHHANRD